ncbi:MarR family transcriptional regulator [Corynebacterium poyangense]|uniref:MarR family transcriptional regulator n=1 Tax=Corynebacterium poyangense TaxID=2684405 RepID=A0A7H0SNT1_9CORY|nr:MarR family winged helix-turn-helix transcriptional regulator [Corynebacterium poyangense]MBZ8177756.1 MarR family transcriptional regulator [Corynebacterium poyangense]QNQ90206.1 MarR family transcriptional regulator [Corynebacterium poyangense]
MTNQSPHGHSHEHDPTTDPTFETGSPDWWSELMLLTNRFSRHSLSLAGLPPTSASWRILGHLARRGPLCIGELADLEMTAQPTASRVIKRLADQGFVETRRSPLDGRATMVHLAPAGRIELRELRHSVAHSLEPLTEVLSDDELKILDAARPVLEKLINIHAPDHTVEEIPE